MLSVPSLHACLGVIVERRGGNPAEEDGACVAALEHGLGESVRKGTFLPFLQKSQVGPCQPHRYLSPRFRVGLFRDEQFSFSIFQARGDLLQFGLEGRHLRVVPCIYRTPDCLNRPPWTSCICTARIVKQNEEAERAMRLTFGMHIFTVRVSA